jgi:hypothetical protein
MTAIEARMQVQKGFLWVLILVAAVIFGFYMAVDSPLLILASAGLGWLATLPYHGRLSAILAITTYGSAFMLPMINGRPFLWEVAAMLGWSGFVITFALRRYDIEFRENLSRYKWAILAAVGYTLVLLYLMRTHGFGIRVFGGDRVGGRVYLQQIACSIFPILFCALRFPEASLVRLFVIHLLLSFTFMISDLALAGGSELWWVFYFLDLANDAISFEMGSVAGGIRRFQSFTIVSVALFQLLLILNPMRNFFNRKALPMILALGLIVGLGLPGGHRGVLVMFVGLWLTCAWAQRVFSVPRVMILGAASILLIGSFYVVGKSLPLAAQRTLTVLPGIELDGVAVEDARATLEGRLALRATGLSLVPNYLWRGRGFGPSTEPVPFYGFDPYGVITESVNNGRFYNGPIGLAVNTGLAGTICLLGFLAAVTRQAYNCLSYIRRHGAEDRFSRLACVIASLWIVQVVVFLFLHGDAEFAMNTFGLLAGLVLACEWSLRKRVQPEVAPVEVEAPSPRRLSPMSIFPARA